MHILHTSMYGCTRSKRSGDFAYLISIGLFHRGDVVCSTSLNDCPCIQAIGDEVLVLSILKFDSSVNQLSATFAGVRDGESFCKLWFEHRCLVESHSGDGKPVS